MTRTSAHAEVRIATTQLAELGERAYSSLYVENNTRLPASFRERRIAGRAAEALIRAAYRATPPPVSSPSSFVREVRPDLFPRGLTMRMITRYNKIDTIEQVFCPRCALISTADYIADGPGVKVYWCFRQEHEFELPDMTSTTARAAAYRESARTDPYRFNGADGKMYYGGSWSRFAITGSGKYTFRDPIHVMDLNRSASKSYRAEMTLRWRRTR